MVIKEISDSLVILAKMVLMDPVDSQEAEVHQDHLETLDLRDNLEHL